MQYTRIINFNVYLTTAMRLFERYRSGYLHFRYNTSLNIRNFNMQDRKLSTFRTSRLVLCASDILRELRNYMENVTLC
jgi:hypothetical protein